MTNGVAISRVGHIVYILIVAQKDLIIKITNIFIIIVPIVWPSPGLVGQ